MLARIRMHQRFKKAPRPTASSRPQLQTILDATWDDDLASMMYLADR